MRGVPRCRCKLIEDDCTDLTPRLTQEAEYRLVVIMLTLNTELQYKKSQYESIYSMRIEKFLSAKCPV